MKDHNCTCNCVDQELKFYNIMFDDTSVIGGGNIYVCAKDPSVAIEKVVRLKGIEKKDIKSVNFIDFIYV